MTAETCACCEARCFGLCSLLDDASAALLHDRSQESSYQRGDEIALQGEPTDRIGVISSGLVRVALLTEDGEQHLIQLLKPGDFVGDPSRSENAFSWEAATPAQICWIRRDTLETLMRDHPQINRAYFNTIARQLEDHRLWTASMRGCNTLQRIAFWINQQLSDLPGTKGAIIQIALTRRDLASLLDMTVETLCRGLHQLADKGAIEMLAPDEIRISDSTKLRQFSRCGEKRVSEVLNCRDISTGKENPFCISVFARPGEKGQSTGPQMHREVRRGAPAPIKPAANE